MGCVENTHDRLERLKCFPSSKAAAFLNFGIERTTFNIFHHHVDRAIAGRAKVVNRHSVWVTKATRCLAFAPEPAEPLCISTYLRWKDFYRYTITKKNVARAINRSHPTFAQHRLNLVLAVEYGIDNRRWVIFQDFTVYGAEANAVVVFGFANSAVFHSRSEEHTSEL